MVSYKLTAALLCAIVPAAMALPNSIVAKATDDHPHKRPGPNDRTGPCPMMNTLANHGFIPRENISMETLVAALQASVGLEEAATRLVGAKALTATTTGNPNTFNLDDLNVHGAIEHDGSLSRGDVAQGDNHSFNKTIWAQTTALFVDDKITIAQGAAARKARLAAAAAANPKFNMSAADVQASMVETALYLRLFGDGTNGNARRDWVKILFEEERLPYEEGFPKTPTGVMTTNELLALAKQVGAA